MQFYDKEYRQSNNEISYVISFHHEYFSKLNTDIMFCRTSNYMNDL